MRYPTRKLEFISNNLSMVVGVLQIVMNKIGGNSFCCRNIPWKPAGGCFLVTRKFFIKRNSNKVDSIETGHINLLICFPKVI